MSEISTRILDQYGEIKTTMSAYPEAKLIAVSKKQKIEKIETLVNEGHKDFGENYYQEWSEKKSIFPDDINWHFIGGLQSRKVAQLVKNDINCIHSLGSLSSIQKYSNLEYKPNLGALIQVNVSGEEQKSGITSDELMKLYDQKKLNDFRGLMTMPPFGIQESETRKYFSMLRTLAEKTGLKELSMGMSGDWKIALDEGATFIRLGTILFGNRDY
jgi:PLP dependent protein